SAAAQRHNWGAVRAVLRQVVSPNVKRVATATTVRHAAYTGSIRKDVAVRHGCGCRKIPMTVVTTIPARDATANAAIHTPALPVTANSAVNTIARTPKRFRTGLAKPSSTNASNF